MPKLTTSIAALVLWLSALPGAADPIIFVDNVSNVAVTNDLIYGSGSVGYGTPGGVTSLDLYFDVYQPTDLTNVDLYPAVFVLPSGGFSLRDRTLFADFATDIASRGYVTFVLDTRIISDGLPAPSVLPSGFDAEAVFGGGPGAVDRASGLLAGIEDVKLAIDYVQANAATFDIDPTKLIAFGSSSGARIALALGVSEATDDVGGVLSMLGAIPGNEGLIDALDASLFLINGLHDTTVPVAGAIAIADQADLVGLPYQLHIGDAGHDASFAFEPIDGSSIWREAWVFFNDQLQLAELVNGGPQPVPEASTLILSAMGASLFLFAARRRSRS